MSKQNNGWFSSLFTKKPPMTDAEIADAIDGLIANTHVPVGCSSDMMEKVRAITFRRIGYACLREDITTEIIEAEFERANSNEFVQYAREQVALAIEEDEVQKEKEKIRILEEVVRKVVREEMGKS